MKRNRLIPALLTAAALCLILSACGRVEAPTPASTPMPVQVAPADRWETAVPGGTAEPAAAPETASAEPSGASADSETAFADSETAFAEPSVTAEPVETPKVTPRATPAPPPSIVTAPVPTAAPAGENGLRAGVYEGVDGSVLTVSADGTATFVTEVSGKVNGKAMSADLTFHGVWENGGFSFDKVTYGAIDLTAIAAAAGYTDASAWETTAALIYAAG